MAHYRDWSERHEADARYPWSDRPQFWDDTDDERDRDERHWRTHERPRRVPAEWRVAFPMFAGYGRGDRGDRFGSWEAHGHTGPHSGRGPRGYRKSDERIREDVCDRLTDDPDVDATEIDVQVASGEVTLSGTVHTRGEKRRACDIADGVGGVRDVHNIIKIIDDARTHERDLKGITRPADAGQAP